jgi:hypothetical protein
MQRRCITRLEAMGRRKRCINGAGAATGGLMGAATGGLMGAATGGLMGAARAG